MENNKSNFITDEEKLKQQHELLMEMNKLNNEMKKLRNKKLIIVFSIIVIIIVIIKAFFGTIELYNIFGASSSKARYYYVTVNNKQVAVSYISTKKIPIIPFLVNFNSVYMGNSYIEDDDTGVFFYQDGSNEYIIDVISYSCYYQNIQTECNSNRQEMKENNDEKYPILTITRITNPYEVVYQGDFVKDISPFITKKGQYHVQITAKYELVETEMYFYFENY